MIAKACIRWPLRCLLCAPRPLSAKPACTVRMGETWLFAIEHGQPASARKVTAAG